MKNRVDHLYQAADLAGMSVKTARKYLRSGQLPSRCKVEHTWKTHEDAFEPDWPWLKDFLEANSGVEAKSLFEHLQRERPGRYTDKQLRTFQRRVKQWKALEGPGQEVFFPQLYKAGHWCESDFTRMKAMGVTICGKLFDHMLYHFVLCYCNWETGSICFSESYESLSAGLQDALWKLGGVPKYHKTDNLTAAVKPVGKPKEFTERYTAFAGYYGFESCKTQPNCPHENGDVEQSHNRFKKAVDQALILRGSRDFAGREEYEMFLSKLFDQLNAGRRERFNEELKHLRQLPVRRYDDYSEYKCTVSRFSTIRVLKNSYSVHSRLMCERVKVRVYAERLEVWYAQRRIEIMPRLHGENGHLINYRHIIDWLVRKPGAFENYLYKDDLFPTSCFRIAYDLLKNRYGAKSANKQYLKILEMAAKDGEALVNEALRFLINTDFELGFETVKQLVHSRQKPPAVTDVYVEEVDLSMYDQLLEYQGVLV